MGTLLYHRYGIDSIHHRSNPCIQKILPRVLRAMFPINRSLLRFLIEEFELNVNPAEFLWEGPDTPRRKRLQEAIVYKLMKSLRESNTCAFDFDDDWDHDCFTLVLIWYLNDPSISSIRARKESHTARVNAEVFDDGLCHSPKGVTQLIASTVAVLSFRQNMFLGRKCHIGLGLFTVS